MMPNLIGKGWTFPIRPTPEGKLSLVSGEEKIRQSLLLILSTAPGERKMYPEFGCGIHDLVFQPNTEMLHARVQNQVRDALIRYEPRIDVVDVRVEMPPEARNFLIVRIDYRIRTSNSFYNLVYPFFLTEGAG
ncbi:MAG: GPW/gp25 family protein [Anaerolineae bacterium]|nr:GPW/gp25 family protein [Anaerolineae bacterium]